MNSDELMHYGVLGMKWGVRRYQNADGSLTDAGRRRYKTQEERQKKADDREVKRAENKAKRAADKLQRQYEKFQKRRQVALSTENPAKLAKYSKYLTDEEVQARINRTRKERELVDLYSQQEGTKYFNKRKAAGDLAMKGIGGLGNGISKIAESSTIYLGKQMIKNVFGDEVYKEMFPPQKEDKKKDN